MAKHYGSGTYNMVDKDGKEYLLTVEQDEYAHDPRDDDNVATIWCWKRGYGIGDSKPTRFSFEEAMIALYARYVNMDEDASYSDMITKLQESDKTAFKLISCYEHSEITISTAISSYPYNDRWDSGIIGFAFIDKETAFANLGGVYVLDENGERIKEEYKHDNAPSTWGYKTIPLAEDNWKQRALDCIDGEVEVLDQYLRGDVYSYTLEEKVHIRNEKKCPHCGEVIEVDEYDDWEEVDSCCGFYGDCLEENGIIDNVGNGFEFVD